MNLMQMLSGNIDLNGMMTPALKEVSEARGLLSECVSLQRETLQAIRENNDLVRGLITCLTKQVA